MCFKAMQKSPASRQPFRATAREFIELGSQSHRLCTKTKKDWSQADFKT